MGILEVPNENDDITLNNIVEKGPEVLFLLGDLFKNLILKLLSKKND